MNKIHSFASIGLAFLALSFSLFSYSRYRAILEQHEELKRELNALSTRATSALPDAKSHHQIPQQSTTDSRSTKAQRVQAETATSIAVASPFAPQHEAKLLDSIYLMVDEKYGDFIHGFGNLGKGEIEEIKNAIAENELVKKRLAWSLSQTQDPMARSSIIEELKARHESVSLPIADAIDPEVGKRLARYQQILPYRDTVGAIANRMRSEGIEIDRAKEAQLLDSFAQVMIRVVQEEVARRAGELTLLQTRAQWESERIEQKERYSVALIKSVSTVLTHEETDAFTRANLDQLYR